MPLVPIYAAPGVCKSTTDYSSGKPAGYVAGRVAQGRYVDGDKIRFVAGYPEKIGGWVSFSGLPTTVDVPRAAKSWRDNTGNPRLGLGTEKFLYYFDGTNLVDITPHRTIVTGTLTNPITTTNGSTTVAIADSTQTLSNGDWVFLSAGSAVGGITLNGWYSVSGRSGTGYNITSPTAANASTPGGGGTVTYNYPRTTLANPFTTTNGSPVVTVSHTAHGASVGDYVTFSGASAVGGLTLNGQYSIYAVNSADTYEIVASGNANASTTGGGSVGVVYNITVSQITTTSQVAYGTGVYGSGPYGYSQTATATAANGWTLAPYGNQLLACPIGGTIYVYDPAVGGLAYPLLNAPTDILAMMVTPERFVVALGTSKSSLQMAWADQTDYTVWTSLPTNTALTGRTKQGGSAFVGGVPARDGVSLAFTDRAAFQLNYSGDNFVYDTPQIADNAGLISPFSAVAFGENVYWMSDTDFWVWNGTVQPLPSDDIRDYVFRDINKLYIGKCHAGVNRAKKEIWFFYPSASSTEIDSYVIFHLDQNCWSIGTMDRTTWEDSNLFPLPLATSSSGVIYQHENGTDADGSAMESYITFAPVDVSNGDANVDVFGFIPDFARLSGNINLTINVRYYPQDANTVVGPIAIADNDTTPRIDLRTDGKMVGFELDSNVIGGDFRVGTPRANVQPAGVRA